MKKTKTVAWVVYEAAGQGETRSVCGQGEWDEMQRREPGRHRLIKEGIASESEAERLARAHVMAAEAVRAEQKKRGRRN